MTFSIYTPTHDTRHLQRAADSLLAQTEEDWEWIIVLNGGVSESHARQVIGEAARRTVFVQEHGQTGCIGALKKAACDAATGQILVELDHDDELLPQALHRIGEEVARGAGFVYSATLEMQADGKPNLYGAAYGWRHATHLWRGTSTAYNVPFECTARSLCELYYAPNHVRAWTREAYDKAGGYDDDLSVTDDHDLLIRTYLAGVEMRRITEPLYVQHLHGANSQLGERNQAIQNGVAALRNTYTRELVDEQCHRSGLPKYDLGGAHSCPDGWQAVDKHGGAGVLSLDVTQGLPWADHSVGAIRAHDFLEHIPIGQVVPLMNEIHRVLVPGGWLLTSTPSTDGRGAFQDPTHCSFWNENSWWYYTRAQQAKYVPEIKARFGVARLCTYHPSNWHHQHHIPYVVADLVALKGQREPGLNGFFGES